MRLKLRHLGLALLAGVGLYVAALLAIFAVGLVAGFLSDRRAPPRPAMIIRYVDRSASNAASSAEPAEAQR